MTHPRQTLPGALAVANVLPVCNPYSGVEARMRKSLALQANLMQEFGAWVVDVPLDCEDGARVGDEREHADMVMALANEAMVHAAATGATGRTRMAVSVHPVGHSAFEQDVETIVSGAGLCHPMIPKMESVQDLDAAVAAVDCGSYRFFWHVVERAHQTGQAMPSKTNAVF